MTRRGVVLAVVMVLAGCAFGGLYGASRDTADRPAPVSPALTPEATPAPAGPFRAAIPGLTRDAPARLFVGALSFDAPAPPPLQPLRLWAGGDSTSVYMADALAETTDALGGTFVGGTSRNSTGLTRPDFFDWPAHLRAELAASDPNVVVLMLGANDLQGLLTPGGAVQPLSEAWEAEYRLRVARAMDDASAAGRLVVWVGQPVMAPDEYNAGMRAINSIYEAEAANHPNTVYLDCYGLFAGDGGEYRVGLETENGSYREMRAPDGVHFTVAGGQYLAQAVVKAIRDSGRYALPPAGATGE